MMTRDEKIKRIQELQAETSALLSTIDNESAAKRVDETWPPKTFYWWYHITTGCILGGVGAIASLFFNIVGSAIIDKNPFELIKVYMTFPMGASALTSASESILIIVGIILFIVTGSFYGVVFEVIMYRYFKTSSRGSRVIAAMGIGVAIWIINFYGILSWLQPMLFDGNWILQMIPFWVALLTHLVFALTMVIIGEWGHFEATDYKRQAMVQAQQH